MKRRLTLFRRRLSVDFGNEPLRPIALTYRPADQSRARVPRQSEATAGEQAGSSCVGNQPLNSAGDMRRQDTGRSLTVAARLRASRAGFTLVEILVVLVLLSLIVFALMAVFAGAQKAFRASITQTDALEGGRAIMDLIASDLATMAPSDDNCNLLETGNWAPVNFAVSDVSERPPPLGLFIPSSYPLVQSLIGSPTGASRTNILEDIFILSKANINGVPSWVGTGYSVNTNLPDGSLYPLYRFYMTTNMVCGLPGVGSLYNTFVAFQYTNSAQWSHLIDGVVNLTARTFDTNGIWMTNGFVNPQYMHVRFARFNPSFANGTPLPVSDCFFYSNALPASVDIELGTLEDRTLQHAEGLSGPAQSNYLAGAAAQVHVFERRVPIRNLDPTAYQ